MMNKSSSEEYQFGESKDSNFLEGADSAKERVLNPKLMNLRVNDFMWGVFFARNSQIQFAPIGFEAFHP